MTTKLIAGRGKLGDTNWGATFDNNRKPLERQLRELKKHFGETVLLTGGGSLGKSWTATLINAEILPMGDNLGLRAYLENVTPPMHCDDDKFEPWINSWQISVLS